MRRNFALAAIGPHNIAACEPAIIVRAQARSDECSTVQDFEHSADFPERARLDILAAARIAQVRVAEARIDSPYGHIERRLQPAQFSLERADPTPNFADAPRKQMHAC